MTEAGSVTSALAALIRAQVERAGGWLPFDRYMATALYAPGLGYYANASRKFGPLPSSGTNEIWEFGAGSGALAAQLLDALGERVQRYTIVDLSSSLRARQRERLAAHGAQVQWAAELPERLRGVVVGNEVLDAMPVKLLHRT